MDTNQITPFNFHGATVRVLTDEHGEPWFIAKDICDVLELDNVTNALRALDSDEKSNITNCNVAQNGGRAPLIVSEAGFYKLVLRSRKPVAKEFQRWVTHEVLPALRRDGAYMVDDGASEAELMARGLLAAQRVIEQRDARIREQQEQLEAQVPKVLFADAVAASDGTCLVGELAKMLTQAGYKTGQNRLFKQLREDGYLGKSGQNKNVPLQRYVDSGLFRIKETAVTHADGHVTLNRTPKVTGKGQRYFIDKYAHHTTKEQ